MKMIYPILGLFILAIGGSSFETAIADSTSTAVCNGALNVMAFGAKGDGVTDDTAAINAAAAASHSYVVAASSTNSYVGSSDPICFPTGTYNLTGEVAMKGYANIYADGDATINQTCATCSTFTFHNGYTVTIKGLNFIGGKNQIYFDNKNIDGSILAIQNTQFQNSSDYAIYTEGTTDGHLSAQISITNSNFSNCRKVMRNVADHVIMRNSSMTMDPANFDADSAAIWNRSSSRMFWNNVTANADMRSGDNRIAHARWIDNGGSLFVDGSTFGGENGGMPIVYQSGTAATAYPWMGKSVVIRNSQIAAGPVDQQDSAVLVLNGAIPQLVLMSGNTYNATGRIFADFMDSTGFVNGLLGSVPPPLRPLAFHVQVENTDDANIPNALAPYTAFLQ